MSNLVMEDLLEKSKVSGLLFQMTADDEIRPSIVAYINKTYLIMLRYPYCGLARTSS